MGLDLTGLGSVFDFGSIIINKIWPQKATPEEKLAAINALVPMLQQREDTVTKAQESIIVAEMQQGDKFTKRARPMVVYAGLTFIALVHIIIPIFMKAALIIKFNASASMTPDQLLAFNQSFLEFKTLLNLSLPSEFWLAWGSVVSIWSIGRSAEKRGVQDKLMNKVVGMVTGNNK